MIILFSQYKIVHWKKFHIIINGYIQTFSIVLEAFLDRTFLEQQERIYESEKKIALQKSDSTEYYSNGNLVISLTPIQYSSLSQEDISYDNLFLVESGKTTGETSLYTEYIPEYFNGTIKTFSDGSIAFESIDSSSHGWYSPLGNKITIPSDYFIIDIIDELAFLKKLDISTRKNIFYILDLKNNTINTASYLALLNNKYIYKKNNNKMVLCDSNMKEISKEYDRIIINMFEDFYFEL